MSIRKDATKEEAELAMLSLQARFLAAQAAAAMAIKLSDNKKAAVSMREMGSVMREWASAVDTAAEILEEDP